MLKYDNLASAITLILLKYVCMYKIYSIYNLLLISRKSKTIKNIYFKSKFYRKTSKNDYIRK